MKDSQKDNSKISREENRKDSRNYNRKKGNGIRPVYGVCSNVWYMVRHAFEVPQVLWMLGIQVAADVMISVTTLYMAPAFLGRIEAHVSLRELIAVIGGFSLSLIFFNAVTAYCRLNRDAARIAVRCNILREIDRKKGTCSYSLLYDQTFQDRGLSARYAVNNNAAPAEKIWQTLHQLLKNGICFGIYLSLMANVKPVLIAVTMVITAVDFVVAGHFDRWDYEHREENARIMRKDRYFYNSAKDPRLAKDIRIFGMQEWLWDIKEDVSRLRRDFLLRGCRNTMLKNSLETLLDLLRNGILYVYLLNVTLQGELSAARFLLYFTAATGFTSQLMGIFSGVAELNRQSMEISNVREFCETEEPFLLEGGRKLSVERGITCAFELRDVAFRYPGGDRPVFEHFNLKINAGEKLAVVGLNGAGKTTLIKLLCGFLDPDSGQVLFNGVDIREYNRQDYYKLFGAVFQDFSILAATIAENVAQSDMPDMDRVRACAEQAGIRERIERFPRQYETKLGKSLFPEEAVDLSGGETQRLMLARMLYKDAPVMVLDEPTAALDAIAERDIYERYNGLARGNTAVYISHRLASTRFCDRVILLGEGKVLEEGTHRELMEQGGKYAQLFEIQSKYYTQDQADLSVDAARGNGR